MTIVNRRQFVAATALGAAATACRNTAPESPAAAAQPAAGGAVAAVAAVPFGEAIADKFVIKPKTESVKDRLMVNCYGLIAVVERRTAGRAEVVCLDHGKHEAKLWYRKADMNLGYVVLSKQVELSFEGIDGSQSLRFQDTDEQPWESLQWILDPATLIPPAQRKLSGVTVNVAQSYQKHVSAAAYLPLETGVLSAGRPWAPLGSYLSWVAKVYKNNDPSSVTSSEATGTQDFSMTDNFNWIAPTKGVVKVRLSDSATPIELTAVDGVTRVCITCDLAKPEPFTTALHHCLAYYDLLGISPGAQDVPFPVFKRGVYGEKDLADVSASSSDPECPTFRIQA